MKHHKWVLTLAALAALQTHEQVLAQNDLASPSLEGVAKSKGCLKTPQNYVTGVLAPLDSESGVFWCEREAQDDEGRYLLVFIKRNREHALSCPDVVSSVNRPIRLAIRRVEQLHLSWFVYRDNPSQSGPETVVSNGSVVDTGDDGVGEQWYCYKGKWLVRVYH